MAVSAAGKVTVVVVSYLLCIAVTVIYPPAG